MQHPALYNDDVLREIFSHIAPSTSRFRTRQILARAARVSIAFSEPALDALWAELDSLDPLLDILAEDLPRAPTGELVWGHVSERTNARFQSYARRVHVLHVLSNRPGAVDPSINIIYKLASSSPELPLFPALSALSWSQPSPFGKELFAFLSHSLCRLDIGVGRPHVGKDSALECLLRTLSLEAPFLQNLTLSGDATPASLQSVVGIHNLRRLNVSGLDFTPDLLGVCAKIDGLTDLSLTLRDVPPNAEFCLPHTGAFASLRSLSIAGPLASTARVLPALISPGLTALSLSAQSPYPEAWTDCVDALTCLPLHAPHLQTLSLKSAFAPALSGELIRILAACEPLLALRALADVELAFRGCCAPLAVSDADIAILARAWPSLARLSLAFPPAPAPRPSLSALSAFAAHCPALHTLQLPLAAGHAPAPAPTGTGPHGLRHLLVVGPGAPIADPAGVTRFLARTFPAVEVGWYIGDQGWRAVHDGLCAARRGAVPAV